MANFKKSVDLTGLDQNTKKDLEHNNPSSKGVAGADRPESHSHFITAPSEKIFNKGNSYVVLGRDRIGSRLSGYGGKGDTHCASIDLVAGRNGYEAKKTNENNEQLWTDPNFKKDATRLYLSQKSDIDNAFGLADGEVGNAKTKSAIALKADGIRIIAREGIKLVTRTDIKNSQGADVAVVRGIDLIAGNDDSDLQPMLKGNNTVECIERLTHHVDKLAGLTDALLHTCMEMNKAIVGHFHNSPLFAQPTTPSIALDIKGSKVLIDQLMKVKKGLVNFKQNLGGFKMKYLHPSGDKFIKSRHNNTN